MTSKGTSVPRRPCGERFPLIHSAEIYKMTKGPSQERKVLWGTKAKLFTEVNGVVKVVVSEE